MRKRRIVARPSRPLVDRAASPEAQGADPAILVGFILSPHTFTSISRSFGRVGLRRWIKAPIRSRAWVHTSHLSKINHYLLPRRTRRIARFTCASLSSRRCSVAFQSAA